MLFAHVFNLSHLLFSHVIQIFSQWAIKIHFFCLSASAHYMSNMISIALLLMTSTIYAVSIDCPNVIEFARGLGMQTAQPAIWTVLQSDCCTAYGVYGDVNERVYQIIWYSIGLMASSMELPFHRV